MNVALRCKKCRSTAAIPDFPEGFWQRIGIIVKSTPGRPMKVIELLRREGGVDLSTGKFVMMHLAKADGNCQQCSAPLARERLSTCDRCNALNIRAEI